jgi:hypothetical protein
MALQLCFQLKLFAVVHLEGALSSVQVIGNQASWSGCLVMANANKIQKPAVSSIVSHQEPLGAYSTQTFKPVAPIIVPLPKPLVNQEAVQSKKNIKKLEMLIQQVSAEIEQAKIERVRQIKKYEPQACVAAAKEVPGLEGIVVVNGREISDLKIGQKPLTLCLNGNARVICVTTPLTFRSIDRIEIRGTHNELVVGIGMHIQGELVFAEPDASLVVRIAHGALVTINPASKRLVLSAGAAFECRGSGSLEIASDCTLLFEKKPSCARIVIADQTQASILGSQGIKIGGVGSFVLDQAACLFIKQHQQFIIGTQDQDYINFIVRGGAMLNLSPGVDAGLIFNKGAYSLSVVEKGFIEIGAGANLGLQDLAIAPGATCKKFTLNSGGRITVASGGLITVGAQVEPCLLDVAKSAITGAGFVACKGLEQLARMQPHGPIGRTCSLGALARSLINKQQSFSWATVFEDADFKDWVFLPKEKADQQLIQGQCFALNKDIMITSEDAVAGKVFGIVRGKFVEITSTIKQVEIPRTRAFDMNQEHVFPGLGSFLAS